MATDKARRYVVFDKSIFRKTNYNFNNLKKKGARKGILLKQEFVFALLSSQIPVNSWHVKNSC